jgi:hypothetical protein
MRPSVVRAAMSSRSLLLGNSTDFDGARINFATFDVPLGRVISARAYGKTAGNSRSFAERHPREITD